MVGVPAGACSTQRLSAGRLGLEVAAVTVCGPGPRPEVLVPDVEWQVIRDATSTTFENRYEGGERSQRVLERARANRSRGHPGGLAGRAHRPAHAGLPMTSSPAVISHLPAPLRF